MGNKKVILLSLAILLLSSSLALADCVSLAGFTSWFAQDAHNVVFYRASRPLGTFFIPDCTIEPSSTVIVIKSYLCDSDKIVIDGAECTIMTATLASFQKKNDLKHAFPLPSRREEKAQIYVPFSYFFFLVEFSKSLLSPSIFPLNSSVTVFV